MTRRNSQGVRGGLLALDMVGASEDSPGADAYDGHEETDLEGAPAVFRESGVLSERLHSLVLGVVHHFG